MTVPPPSDSAPPDPSEAQAESGFEPAPLEPPVEPAPVEHAPTPAVRPYEPHDEGPWSGGLQGPPPVIPRQRPVRAKPSVPVRPIIIAAAAVVVLGGLGYWMFSPSDDESTTPAADSITTTTASVSPETDARERLRRLLPPGYSGTACEPVATPKGALAKFGCEANSDPGGPPLATYTLMRDAAGLKTAFDDIIAASKVVNCPGSIQSPGPWRRNASPQKVAGTLFCGFQQDLPTVAWTDAAGLVVSAVRGDASGPTLDQLYLWWSSHS